MVASVGAVISFGANAISPRGLKLTRDFFGSSAVGTTNSVHGTNQPASTSTNSATPLELLTARLESKGLHLVHSNRVVELFRDPRHQQGLVAFIDAREDSYYQEGHIPGAYQLDYYRPEAYLPTVLPVCQIAAEIVVYCNGGNCEDSEFAANFLLAAGIPSEKLLVYVGGMTEWITNGFPVEIGMRQSGVIREAAQKTAPSK
jgi:rhodanese-related sulfurtransferase